MQKRFFHIKGHPFVFLSTTGQGGRGATEEATLSCDRLNQELEKLGGSIKDVVRITIFTRDQECRPAVSEVRKKAFPQATRPASSSIIVHDFSPEDTLIETDATAFLSKGKKYMKRGVEFDPPRPYLKALMVENLLFLSGAGGRGENIEVQTRTACNFIGETLTELGSSWAKVLLVSCYVRKLEWFDTVHGIVQGKLGKGSIPVDLVMADEYAQPNMLVEIEATAYK